MAMAIERWRPWREMARSPFRGLGRGDRDNFFDRFFSDWLDRWDMETPGGGPSVDMVDQGDEVLLRADIPGLSEKDIDVSFHDGIITIKGERKEEREEKKGENYYCAERWAGSFSRSLMLPPGVDPDKSNATFSKGVLEVHLPKMKGAAGRKIEIKAA